VFRYRSRLWGRDEPIDIDIEDEVEDSEDERKVGVRAGKQSCVRCPSCRHKFNL